MVQVAILSGLFGGSPSGLDRSVPVNLIPVAEPNDGSGTGISKGYLQTVFGIDTAATVTGKSRGASSYDGRHIRVFGNTLYEVTGTKLRSLGQLLDDGKPVEFAEGFGRLGVVSGGKLYYLIGEMLTQVTDPDLGEALSVTWSDGFFITTDGTSIVVTELNDPAAVDPQKYGSSEADPDPIVGVLALRGEVFAVNRYSIEKFLNTGSTGFPFQRSRGSQIPKGAVSAAAFVPFVETFAFCGSARNESVAVYLAGAGQAIKISPRVLDGIVGDMSDDQLDEIELEATNNAGLYQLLVHLPDETWVYHWSASQLLDVPVWSRQRGGSGLDQPWPARHYLRVGSILYCGGEDALGVVNPAGATLFGDTFGYQFDTPYVYNAGAGAIIHDAELVKAGQTSVAMSYTNDGRVWSQERFAQGKRLAWRRLGRLANYRGFRFRGIVEGPASFSRLEMRVEPLGGA